MKKKRLFIMCVLIPCLLGGCGKKLGGFESTTMVTERESIQEETLTNRAIDPSLVGKRFASGDYEYEVQEDGAVYISGYIGNKTELVLPQELDGYSVKGIADEAFCNADSIISLVVPGLIKSIGREAFAGCLNLKTVKVEEGVEYIGKRAFANGVGADYNCSTIEEAIIPNSVTRMGEKPFGLRSNVMRESNGLLYVGKFIVDTSENFDGHVVFDEDVLGIADEAFFDSSGWKTKISDAAIEIPASVKYIGHAAFAGQDNIEYFRVPVTVEEIGDYAMLYDYVNHGFELYHSNDTRKIYGEEDSMAECYSQKNGLNFVIVNK